MRRPRLLSKAKIRKHAISHSGMLHGLSIQRRTLSPVSQLYKDIEEVSVLGYQFADNLYGMSYISESDISQNDNNIFIVRFRCPSTGGVRHGLEAVVKKICESYRCDKHLFVEEKSEYGMSFLECIWVLQNNMEEEL